MPELDAADTALLKALRDDSRLSLRELGAVAGLSAPAVAARLRRLEDSGVIAGYTVRTGPDISGLRLECRIAVRVPPPLDADFCALVQASAAVGECLAVTGDYSYLVSAEFAGTADLEAFVSGLRRRFGATQTMLVLRRVVPGRAVIPGTP